MQQDDITNQNLKHENELLNQALTAAGIGTWTLDPVNGTVEWDKRCQWLYGVSKDEVIPYDQILEYVHPEDRKLVRSAVANALTFISGGRYELQFRVLNPSGTVRWLFCKGQAYFNDQQIAYRFTGTAQDITDSITARNDATDLSRHSELALLSAGAGSFRILMDKEEFEYSPLLKKIFTGTTGGSLEREDLLKSIHPDDLPIRDAAYKLAETTGILEYQVRVIWNDGTLHWVSVTGRYEFGSNGEPFILSGIATDVTAEQQAQHELERSEHRFRSLIEQAPIATCLFVGEEMRIEVANQMMIEMWGKGPSVIGKPLLIAVPELLGQPFPDILAEVYATGKTHTATSAPAVLEIDGVMGTYYFDYTYKPLFDEHGNVYGVMDMATDVTARVLAEIRMKETETTLRSAIALGKFEVWEVDPVKSTIAFSERFANWMGIPEHSCDLRFFYDTIDEADRQRVEEAYTGALASGFNCDVEFLIKNRKNGRKRILHALGKALFDTNRKIIKVTGIIQDITEQKNIQLALEHLVQAKTEELEASNEELAATNEELAESNLSLGQSNRELEQYAYAASHDLQEPLRKIQTFTDRLMNTAALQDEQQDFLKKIHNSAARMTLLIRELLKFSRLKTSEQEFSNVNLSEVVKNILNDFELLIAEQQASIDVGELPTVEGIGAQLNQLFYNLISNALKFVSAGRKPVIAIHARAVSHEIVSRYMHRAIPHKPYYEIIISDNGIGIAAGYHEQIFEIFKRLHSKEKYPGSGIGLAISRRIINNHNGFIAVDAADKEGSTFHVFLPALQK